jgi:hypothetical protein
MKIAKFSLVIAVFLASVAAVGQEKKTPWKVSGDLEEACSCDAACPCWFDSKPTKMTCGGGQVIFIEKGSYGDVSLDGLAIAMMGQSPEGKTMMESIGNWNFMNFYVDEKATPAQRKALEAILQATSPPAVAAEKIKIRYVPITRKINGDEHVVTLGQYASFSGHLIPGGMGTASPRLVNSPGADPIHKEYSQGRTSKQTLDDAGQKWSWSNSNYMFTTFNVSSDDYDKFATMMMQEMEKAKAAKTKS